MKRSRSFISTLAIIIIGLTVSACGVKSTPQHPRGSNFPTEYPLLEKSLATDQEGRNKRFQRIPRLGSSSGIYQYPNPPSYTPPKE